jgi:hypothetical protein
MRFLATPSDKESAATKAARKRASQYNPDSQSRLSSMNQRRNYSLQTGFNLQPEEFCMFMRSRQGTETLHTYSATQGFSPSSCFVQTQAELYDCFPGLANVPLERFARGKFLALHVPIVLHSKNLVGDTELAIRWVFKAPARNPPVSVSSRTMLYLNGRPMYCDRLGNRQFHDNQNFELTDDMHQDWLNFTKEYDAAEVAENNDTIEVDSNGHYSSGGCMVQYYVPFSSTFWARYLYHVALLQRQATELETRPLQADEDTEDRQNQLAKKHLEFSTALSELTAVQEIIARSELGEPQVVMTVHFSFSHAASKENAVTTWQYLDMASAFDDAIPLSAVSQISQSASDSQESALSVQDTYAGGSHDYTGFDLSTLNGGHHYPDPSHKSANGLASPIDLHDAQATAGYHTSWLLPTSSSDLDHLASTVLDPLLPHNSQSNLQQHNLHDVNSFDFSNGNISISLDSSALSPHQPLAQSAATSFSAIDALDLDLAATDPLLLQPSRTTTPWLQSSNATPTDYAAIFSQPHSPANASFPDYSNQNSTADLADHLAAASGALTDTFDVNTLPACFSLSSHQAFAGAGNTTSDLDTTSRNHSFSAVSEDAEPIGGVILDANFSPSQHQGFGYVKQEFSHDGFALSQSQDQGFEIGRQDSFAVGQGQNGTHTGSFGAGGTDTHDFAHEFGVGGDDVAAATEFDIGDLRGSGSQAQGQGHRETWGGAGF